jgi:Copper type II ascorbate-dependent monooxygenase, C-terminal domain
MEPKTDRLTYFVIITMLYLSSGAQQVQFASSIAPVIYKSCTPCHQQGKVAPFALENYAEVKQHAKMIRYVMGEAIMPPWKADVNYRRFHNERKLDSGFLALFVKWMDSGYPVGSGNTDFVPQLSETQKAEPDYVIRMPKPLKLDISNNDVFVSYVDSIPIDEERYLRGVTIIPGNPRLLHHCRVDFDTSDACTQFLDKTGFLNTDDLNRLQLPAYAMVGDYVPGISAYHYPDGAGVKLTKKVYVTVNLHYSPNSKEDYDSTKVYIYFYPKGYKLRQVTHLYVRFATPGYEPENARITGDSLRTVAISTVPIDTDISLISIQPHMHLLGKSVKIYAVTPLNDTVPLIKINDWDFNWQEIYYFEKPVILPKGTVINGVATFDNTASNPHNPFYPPKDIYFNSAMKTTNEMFEFYLQSVLYRPGDENFELYK